jgi:hypothetical protein
MRTLTQYLDLARARQGLDSDRKLSLAVGLTGPGIHYWRKGRALPSDESMVNLATLAGVDLAEALLDLNQWRAGGAARSVYMEMANKLRGTAASLIVAVSFAAAAIASFGAPSQATTLQSLDNVPAHTSASIDRNSATAIYIMRFRRALARAFRKLCDRALPAVFREGLVTTSP